MMPAWVKPSVTRATCAMVTPFSMRASRRSEATSSPPEMAMQPEAASRRQRSGEKVFSKRMLPHQVMATRRLSSSTARSRRARGGAASSTK